MEGLEITIFSFRQIFIDNEEFRIDSEYYKKEYLNLYLKIESHPILSNLVYMSDLSTNGSFKAVSDIIHDGNEKTVPFIRSGNTGNLFINKSELEFISPQAHKKLTKSTTLLHDIIMARKGKIGGASIVTEEEVDFNCNENVIKLTLLEPKKIDPWYFGIFFNSQYGLKQIERLATGNVQPWVSIFQIKKLITYVASDNVQNSISKIAQTAHSLIVQSKQTYTQAETLLLETLGMANFTPSSEAVNIKSFKDSFGASGRLDAEYYQPKYEQVIAHIQTQSHQRLIDLVNIQKSVEPGSDAYCDDGDVGLSFLRVADFSKNGLTPPQKQLKSAYVSENLDKLQNLKPRKDTILFSKDGSVGEAYCLTEDIEAITSGAVLHLSVKNTEKLLPEYLTLALNSKLVKMQSERDAGGSIILHWRVSEIENVVVPLVDMNIQKQIAALVQESFTLKAQSAHLLDVAKRAVEMAIEQDEAAAMEYITDQT